jgi:hypothetical protein
LSFSAHAMDARARRPLATRSGPASHSTTGEGMARRVRGWRRPRGDLVCRRLAWRSIHWKPNPEFEVGAMAARFALLAAPFAAWHIWQGVPWIAAMTATTVASFLFGSVVLRWPKHRCGCRSSYRRQLRSRHGAAPVDQFSNGAHSCTARRSITSTTSVAARHYVCYPPDREYLPYQARTLR